MSTYSISFNVIKEPTGDVYFKSKIKRTVLEISGRFRGNDRKKVSIETMESGTGACRVSKTPSSSNLMSVWGNLDTK